MTDTQHTKRRPPGARRSTPPEVPDEYDLTAQWRTGSPRQSVNFEVYGRRHPGDAHIRIIDNGGSMDAGRVEHGGTRRAIVRWSDEAVREFEADWLDEQAAMIKQRLADRWRAS